MSKDFESLVIDTVAIDPASVPNVSITWHCVDGNHEVVTDTQRLDWLIENRPALSVNKFDHCGFYHDGECYFDEDPREAIDKAMKAVANG